MAKFVSKFDDFARSLNLSKSKYSDFEMLKRGSLVLSSKVFKESAISGNIEQSPPLELLGILTVDYQE